MTDPTNSPHKDEDSLYDQQRHVTSNITDMCRYINFGIIAACYALIASSNAGAALLFELTPRLILGAAVFSSLSLLLDYLQFAAGYISVCEAIKSSDFQYNTRSLSYRARRIFFFAKQGYCLISILFFIASLLKYANSL